MYLIRCDVPDCGSTAPMDPTGTAAGWAKVELAIIPEPPPITGALKAAARLGGSFDTREKIRDVADEFSEAAAKMMPPSAPSKPAFLCPECVKRRLKEIKFEPSHMIMHGGPLGWGA